MALVALGFGVALGGGTAARDSAAQALSLYLPSVAACAAGGIPLLGVGFFAGGVDDLEAPSDVLILFAALESVAPLLGWPGTGT